ncbi:hypothetical protein BMS3Bbin05_02279 [bacterium BMS3Bbin05]|nr:hypothetical protein BMS3Bbin05_02279 [bacterium BMS3Bbin05]
MLCVVISKIRAIPMSPKPSDNMGISPTLPMKRPTTPAWAAAITNPHTINTRPISDGPNFITRAACRANVPSNRDNAK